MKDYSKIQFAGLLALTAVSAITLIGSAALAQQPLVPSDAKAEAPQAQAPAPAAPAQPASPAPAPQAAAPALARLALASAIVPGEPVSDGDYVSSSRFYGDWRLACDEIESRNRRVCRLEQELGLGGKWALTWKLVESSQKKPFFLVSFPAAANPANKVQLAIGGFIREFGKEEWACSGSTCEFYIPADTTAQQLILGASNIRFRYALGSETIELAASMKGFMTALDTLVDEPSAVQTASTHAAAAKPNKPERKRVASRQFETIRRTNDPMPDALKKIYGVN
ncbi:invasion associated locus B family protein [Microvirga lotononidis]|uniref:Invasion associated locus B (IalB) protein n=1 Tax=Microvirga lotononidis TaxID=864069 RepID=I4YRE1_9HYPH|nr:invasion associated locus B family protein [Microvirga lotononidis]EIM26533.1 Invasion associated locus B (IalB) protein [Microvirga lotononidis]WQO31217.1 invasion associated locus B family protein [Microvirga lotononidis]